MNKNYILILFSILFLFSSCDKETEPQFNLDQLCDTNWGIPYIVSQGSADYVDLSAPTIFHKDGTMEIGNQIYDFWRTYDSKSILIQNISELWIIIELNDTLLHVNKIKHPKGDFVAECIYKPE